MRWTDLVASLVSSLAWPAVALTLGLVFRHELTALLRRVTRWEGDC